MTVHGDTFWDSEPLHTAFVAPQDVEAQAGHSILPGATRATAQDDLEDDGPSALDAFEAESRAGACTLYDGRPLHAAEQRGTLLFS